jgi:hypothetical protein
MDGKFQFTTRRVLGVMLLAALWVAVAVSYGHYFINVADTSLPVHFTANAALLTLPCVAVGVLAGRAVIGLLCGLAASVSNIAFYAYVF